MGNPDAPVAPGPLAAPATAPPEAHPAAILALHDAHASRVHWVVTQILGEGPDAEDCTQEVWARVQERLHQLDDPAKAGPWIGSVARNEALGALRGAARQRRILRASLEVARYEDAMRGTPDELPASTPLLAAVEALDPEQRRLVALRLEDTSRTLEDLATRIEVPTHRAKYLWQKAKEALRAKLSEWGAAETYLGT